VSWLAIILQERHADGCVGAAVRVAEAFVNSTEAVSESGHPRPFIYLSAEDIFRPVVPSAYIDTKREAEGQIDRMINTKTNYRGVYMRPSGSLHGT
jgi:hypothetical protein